MTRTYCDKCGTEIEDKPVDLEIINPLKGKLKKEICISCFSRIIDGIDSGWEPVRIKRDMP